jgi:uncharacterized protein YbjQ (UPF0145 family)
LQRLQHIGHRPYTSTLSASDALLLRQGGVRPLTHVTGSAVFALGQWQRPVAEGEVIDLQLWNQARIQALQRLWQAAEAAGSNAVIDVRLSRQNLKWADCAMREYRASGTAVQVKGRKKTPLGLTTLSARDFWKLYTSGWWPCGVVSATTVYRVPHGHPVQTAKNVELVDSSRGMRRAAHLTMAEADRQVRALQASGLVGTVIEHGTWEEEVVEVEPGREPERGEPERGEPERGELEEHSYLYCRFDLVGTAVIRYAPRRPLRVQPVLWLNGAGRSAHLLATSREHDGAESKK